MDRVDQKKNETAAIKDLLSSFQLEPTEINPYFEEIESAPIAEKQKAEKILLRPSVNLKDIAAAVPKLATVLSGYDEDSIEQAEIQVKYQVYIDEKKTGH